MREYFKELKGTYENQEAAHLNSDSLSCSFLSAWLRVTYCTAFPSCPCTHQGTLLTLLLLEVQYSSTLKPKACERNCSSHHRMPHPLLLPHSGVVSRQAQAVDGRLCFSHLAWKESLRRAAALLAGGFPVLLRRKQHTVFTVCLPRCVLLRSHWCSGNTTHNSTCKSTQHQPPFLNWPCWGEHGRGMAVHLGNFLSAKQDVRLQADLNSLTAFPDHLQHCLVTGPERRCQPRR